MLYNNIMNYNDLYKVFKPKCELLGYCPETRGCGKKGKRTDESKRTDEAQKPLDFIWEGKSQTKVVSRDERYDLDG